MNDNKPNTNTDTTGKIKDEENNPSSSPTTTTKEDLDPMVALYGGKTDKPLPPTPPFLWTSSHTAYQEQEVRFSAFEPCYIACIKNLEWQLKRKCQKIDISTGGDGDQHLVEEMGPLLLEYSQMLEALSKISSRDRVFEEDLLVNPSGNTLVRYSGSRRRITRPPTDSDRLHDHLRHNVILIILEYIYLLDIADALKKRFGNLTRALDRFLIALLGGVSLLVPMILMTFLVSRTARLVIVCVATMVFAGGMSFSEASKEGVVGSTAAYAAIMVVYIGSSDTMGM
ncbi:VIT family domain-containing [Lecanosticta acicola]|uniref:VIT family domain-containing n=1 Tax=Lecanosticta acicola TaxID=111012 RepID=A0AAI8Z610_9PEZI|nr:VIT family domain-containing [Lecanosticta acicola]